MDRLTPERRSWLMSRIKGAHTRPELTVRSLLYRMGYRFRLHRRDLPGTPDIVLPGRNVVVFVHGCFWHGHACKRTKMPKSRKQYWVEKIAGNRARDARKRRMLQALGWKVVVVWECELKRPGRLADKLDRALDAQETVMGKSRENKPNRYSEIVAEVFRKRYGKGVERFGFERDEFAAIAEEKGIKLPKNLGDAIYSFKYRQPLPESITRTAPEGYEWIIAGAGKAKYEFRLVKPLEISPGEHRLVVKIPDATPQIIAAYALGDEQALLAKVRYNRLIDVFLGITASSLQNHLRTTVKGIGQIEIDELYVGLDGNGCQYVVPVQAKGGKDKHGRQQTEQDIACCEEKFPALRCRPVSAQFITANKIAMFELTEQEGDIKIVSEEHYELVPAASISAADLAVYASRKGKVNL